MEKMNLQADSLAKTYSDMDNQLEVIKDASVKIQKGEFVMVVGPSGSGKSTLLYLLSGLRRPSRGTVFWDGIAFSELDENRLARLRYEEFGFVIQQHLLVPYLNAVENVCLARSTKLKGEAKRILADLGLKNHFHKFPRELSYGERQRVAVARGLVHKPRLLFADEPTASVNSELAKLIVDYLENYCNEGGSCLMVTHDQTLLPKATRVLDLQDGVLVEKQRIVECNGETDAG